MASQRRVTVSGPAQAGPDGVLIAPLSGLECVFYRIGAESWQVHSDAHHWRPVVGLSCGAPVVDGVVISRDLVEGELVVCEELRVRKPPGRAEAPMLHRLAELGLLPSDELSRKANAFDTLAWKVTEHIIRPRHAVEATGKLVTRRGRRELRRPFWPI